VHRISAYCSSFLRLLRMSAVRRNRRRGSSTSFSAPLGSAGGRAAGTVTGSTAGTTSVLHKFAVQIINCSGNRKSGKKNIQKKHSPCTPQYIGLRLSIPGRHTGLPLQLFSPTGQNTVGKVCGRRSNNPVGCRFPHQKTISYL